MSVDNSCNALDWPPRRPPCSRREACTGAGLDRDGDRCPDCRLRELCDSERRWLVKFWQTDPQRH